MRKNNHHAPVPMIRAARKELGSQSSYKSSYLYGGGLIVVHLCEYCCRVNTGRLLPPPTLLLLLWWWWVEGRGALVRVVAAETAEDRRQETSVPLLQRRILEL